LVEAKIKHIVEAALLAAGRPLSLDNLLDLFLHEEKPERKTIREALGELRQEYEGRAIQLVEVGSGFRINVQANFAPWISRLWEERPPRYSRALMETLALIAYRQPITRGEIEDIRGVSVSSNIVKTLMEREWVREVGHRDVPGKPALLATTREFLNYFGLKSLDELPTLAEIKDLDSINCELELDMAQGEEQTAAEEAPVDVDNQEVESAAEETQQLAQSEEPAAEGEEQTAAEEAPADVDNQGMESAAEETQQLAQSEEPAAELEPAVEGESMGAPEEPTAAETQPAALDTQTESDWEDAQPPGQPEEPFKQQRELEEEGTDVPHG
jgi:segregation and condensation protein B